MAKSGITLNKKNDQIYSITSVTCIIESVHEPIIHVETVAV